MNKSTIKTIFAVALCAAFATSCGSSSSKELTWEERTVELSDGVILEVVKTPDGLWFGKTEVTQAQWETVMGDNPSHFKNPSNPVEMVLGNDCQAFLEKLNAFPAVKKSGLTFRLPTTEEWEYACRAGATGDYCRLADGTEITEGTLGQVAWFRANSDERTHPVGQKQPNAFGLYDMLGNVGELTLHKDKDGESRLVWRGGVCEDSSEDCDTYWRMSFGISAGSWYLSSRLGFRLCAEETAK